MAVRHSSGLVAITRPVSDSVANCELTHVAREPIDIGRARAQHAAYKRALEAAGCRIADVEAAHDLPDAVFVEDTALVVDEVAIITRPGAASRRAEAAGVADVLGRYRELRHIQAPGTIDGGDVVIAGRRVFIGLSSRTNEEAIAQVRSILQRYDYEVRAVQVQGCLHLKSAATTLSENRLLVNPAWISRGAFDGLERLEVDPREPYAANILRAGDAFIYPTAYPWTTERLQRSGVTLSFVDMSELAKAEGAVTCCSVIFAAP